MIANSLTALIPFGGQLFYKKLKEKKK